MGRCESAILRYVAAQDREQILFSCDQLGTVTDRHGNSCGSLVVDLASEIVWQIVVLRERVLFELLLNEKKSTI
jgi:hypothetical protein